MLPIIHTIGPFGEGVDLRGNTGISPDYTNINGINLTNVTQVLVGGIPATNIDIQNDNQLTFAAPPQTSIGWYRLEVCNAEGCSKFLRVVGSVPGQTYSDACAFYRSELNMTSFTLQADQPCDYVNYGITVGNCDFPFPFIIRLYIKVFSSGTLTANYNMPWDSDNNRWKLYGDAITISQNLKLNYGAFAVDLDPIYVICCPFAAYWQFTISGTLYEACINTFL